MPHFHYFFNAERAHKLSIKLLSMGLVPGQKTQDDSILVCILTILYSNYDLKVLNSSGVFKIHLHLDYYT